MNNPYLEKSASLYSFWKDFSGKEHSDLIARKHHLERAIANNDTVEGLSHKIKDTGQRVFRARAKVGAGVVGGLVSGIAASKAYSHHQDSKARKNLSEILQMQKSAAYAGFVRSSASKLSKRLKPVASSIGKTTSEVGKSALSQINTAHGGGVNEFAKSSFGADTPNFKKFVGTNKRGQRAMAFKQGGRKSLDELKRLHQKRTNARVGVYGTAGTVYAAYSNGKSKGRAQAIQQMYY